MSEPRPRPPDRERLVALRRALHRHPEPAWCEFFTTARVLEECERIGVDELHVGPDALATGERTEVPDEETLAAWAERAREAGVDEATLERLAGGTTGAVAVLRRGEGPTVGLRVDLDALPREESTDPAHLPAAEGFRAETPAMHACGHDAHATIGVGVLEALAAPDSGFAGTLKVFFQPAEEVVAGGRAMAASGHLDDVDALLAVHVGLDHPTGEVVAGVEEILAVSQFSATFTGEAAHAGGHPERGRNAVQAMAAAVQNLQAAPRHGDGPTRVNAGVVAGGSATNIVPERASIEGEVRGGTVDLRDFVADHAERVVAGAARMHDCEATFELGSGAPGGENDPELVDRVADAARGTEGVDSVLESAPLGGSEDATYLMRRVQERGGLAAFVCVGTDHPGGHHTATFDVDEDSLPIGVAVLSTALRDVARGLASDTARD